MLWGEFFIVTAERTFPGIVRGQLARVVGPRGRRKASRSCDLWLGLARFEANVGDVDPVKKFEFACSDCLGDRRDTPRLAPGSRRELFNLERSLSQLLHSI